MQNQFIFETEAFAPENEDRITGDDAGSVRDLQRALNRELGTDLPLNGVIGFRTRRAIRDFQRRAGLPADGTVTQQTAEALGFGRPSRPKNFGPDSSETFAEQEFGGLKGLFGRLREKTAGLTPIEDRTAITAKKYGHLRKGKRKKVWALVLHHTAGALREKPEELDHVNSHFVITPKGRILQLHPIESELWASHGYNPGSVAVEFVGNFRNEKGMCWYPKLIEQSCSLAPTGAQLKHGYFNKNGKCGYYGGQMKPCSNTPTAEQIKAGRDLIRHLINKIGLKLVVAHRQSSKDREGDPGPDIWYHVGQWAIDNLGLKDGPPAFIGDGKPILDSWRTWGRRNPLKPATGGTNQEFPFVLRKGASSSAPGLGGPKTPAGFKPVTRKGVLRGLSRYAREQRLDRILKSMKQRGLISVSDADIDTFQRIANVETGGAIQALNSWDSAVVSIGFMQWTLQHGKVQEWIRRAPAAFRRFGIELDSHRKYQWSKDNAQAAVRGAATKDELRWNGWAERFYNAGLDEAVIRAEVELAKEWLQRQLAGVARRLKSDYQLFKTHYDASPWLRGIFQAAYNNLPKAAIIGTQEAVRIAKARGINTTPEFRKLFADSILAAYKSLNDDGRRVVSETQSGSRP